MLRTASVRLRKLVPERMKRELGRTFFETNHDERNTVFLAGTGRSGTSWVGELINYDNAYRDMFEPFHARYVTLCRDFVYSLYLRPDDTDETYLAPARAVLTGRVRDPWIDARNRALFPSRRLIKEVRANLWLAWLRRQFPSIPIVMLMRHPCAVASSRTHEDWATRVPQFLAQRALFEDHLEPFRELIERSQTTFEKHVIAWCIHHYVPLRQFSADALPVVFYEELCARPHDEIRRLFGYIGRKCDDGVFERLRLPSRSSERRTEIKGASGSQLVDSWRKRVTPDESRQAVKILRAFGLDAIYGEDPMPDRAGLAKLFGA